MYEAFIGQVILVALDYVPAGWYHCDGRSLKVNDHHALFHLLNNKYGGDGMHQFILPDLREKEKEYPGMKYVICHSGTFPVKDE